MKKIANENLKSYKIIHLPGHRDGYQRSLLGSLRDLGLDVKYGRSGPILPVLNYSLLFNLIWEFKVDIIHLHWQHPFLIGDCKFSTILKSLFFILQLLLVKISGKKVVWTVHNLVNHEKKHEELEIFFSGIIGGVANLIIAHCEKAKGKIQSTFNLKNKDKITIIPHGTFIHIYKNTLSRAEARKRLNLSPKDMTFLFLGLIRTYKGVLELIECYQTLNCSSSKLIIAGKVPNEKFAELIRKKAGKNSNIQLVFASVPNDEMQIYMNAADILVYPYRDILTSGSVFSAMSFGKVIIAPHIGCIPEVLDCSGAFLYDPNEKDGLLNAMKLSIIVSKAKIKEMGNYNLKFAEKQNWQDIAYKTYRAYEKCLGRTPGSA